MRLHLLFAAIAIVVLAIIPGSVFAALFNSLAFSTLDLATSIVGIARRTTLSAQLSVCLALNTAEVSGNASSKSLQLSGVVLGLLDGVVLQVHSIAMKQMGDAVSSRLDAAESVTDALHMAWETGFLKSCNINSPHQTLASFAVQFLEQVHGFPSFFKYVYYDEPNPEVAEVFTDCGWGSSPNYTFYAMGNDGRYVYWDDDPKVTYQNYLWKDENATSNMYTEYQLSILETAGMLWYSYVYSDVINGDAMPPALLYSRWLSTKNGSLSGIFGADLDMDFLSTTLQRSLVSPLSVAFVVDLGRNHGVIAHTLTGVPLFTTSSTDNSLEPFAAEEFPNDLLRAAVEGLKTSFGSLESVSTSYSETTWNGTAYLCSTLAFYRRGLHWLSCQLTPKMEFQGRVSSAAEELTNVLVQGQDFMSITESLQNTLGDLASSADATVKLTVETTSSLRSAVVGFVTVAGCVLAGCLALTTFVVFRIVHVVRHLSRVMAKVAGMQLEGVQLSSTIFLELGDIQHAFARMVVSLSRFRHFLPSQVATPENGQSLPRVDPSSQYNSSSNPLRVSRSSRSSTPSAEFCPVHNTLSIPDNDRRFSIFHSAAEGFGLQFGTVVCISHAGAELFMQCLTPAMFSRRASEMLTLLKSCTSESNSVNFFGDQFLAVYQRPGHCTAAVEAVARLRASPAASRFQFSMGVSCGKVLGASMGAAEWRACNILGGPVGTAAALCRLCTTAEVDVLVEEEVMEKARFAFLFTPVALVEFDGWRHARGCYYLCRALSAESRPQKEEWMYSLAALEERTSLEANSREQLVTAVFHEWRQSGTLPGLLPQLEAAVQNLTSTSQAAADTSFLRDGCGFLIRCIRFGHRSLALKWHCGTAAVASSNNVVRGETVVESLDEAG